MASRHLHPLLISKKKTRNPVGDRCAINIAPLQLDQDVLWIHSARLEEALVTTSIYLDARNLKRA
jgi:hypothetical protein